MVVAGGTTSAALVAQRTASEPTSQLCAPLAGFPGGLGGPAEDQELFRRMLRSAPGTVR